MMFLLNWFEKFPEYKSREFFLTGESYAGVYFFSAFALVTIGDELVYRWAAILDESMNA